MTAAVGTLGALGLDTVSPVTKMIDFRSESLQRKDESVDGNGVRGTRARHIARVRASLQKIGGPLSFQPNALDLGLLLQWIMCGTVTNVAGTNNWYKLGESAVTRYVAIDRRSKVFTYAGVGVNRATFKCEQGQMLGIDIDTVALTETVGNSGTFPALQPDRTTNPFILSDLTLSVNGVGAVTAKSLEIVVENHIDEDRFFNSNTMSEIVMLDRNVSFKTRVPYGDWSQFYNLGAGTGVSVIATLTNGSWVLSFTMGKVVFPPMSPVIPGREEVMLELDGKAYRDGATTDDTTQELVTKLDYGA